MDGWQIKIGEIVNVGLFNVGKDLKPMAPAFWVRCVAACASFVLPGSFVVLHSRQARISIVWTLRHVLEGRFMVHESQSNLLHVVAALHASCSFTSCLHCGQKQTNQNTDDGNNHQQLD